VNLFDTGRRQIKAALALTKADLFFLPECNPDKSGLLAAQKQLLELPLIICHMMDLTSKAVYERKY